MSVIGISHIKYLFAMPCIHQSIPERHGDNLAPPRVVRPIMRASHARDGGWNPIPRILFFKIFIVKPYHIHCTILPYARMEDKEKKTSKTCHRFGTGITGKSPCPP
jgi:hypothetical protein